MNALYEQLVLDFEMEIERKVEKGTVVELLPLDEYDYILLACSAGKDSMACYSKLMRLGVPPEKIELVHHAVDGREDTHRELFDWPFVESYLEALGEHYGSKTSYQWRAYGIYGELMRKDSLTGDVYYYGKDGGIVHLPTTRGKKNTRLKWPAMSADLRTRWCSAYVKIDVFRRWLNDDPRFRGTPEKPVKTLLVSGERAQESPNRARYNQVELHACHAPSKHRIVHHWRPIHHWSEERVWQEYEYRKWMPGLPYLLGFSRTSCLSCIFLNPDHWATVREIAPERFQELVRIERELGHTIDPGMTLEEKANKGKCRLPKDPRTLMWIEKAMSKSSFDKNDLFVDQWELPAGAFKGAAGGPI